MIDERGRQLKATFVATARLNSLNRLKHAHRQHRASILSIGLLLFAPFATSVLALMLSMRARLYERFTPLVLLATGLLIVTMNVTLPQMAAVAANRFARQQPRKQLTSQPIIQT